MMIFYSICLFFIGIFSLTLIIFKFMRSRISINAITKPNSIPIDHNASLDKKSILDKIDFIVKTQADSAAFYSNLQQRKSVFKRPKSLRSHTYIDTMTIIDEEYSNNKCLYENTYILNDNVLNYKFKIRKINT